MSEGSLVSIIVPVYMVEAFVEQAIESLVGQTYANIEIILVDDGSTDLCGQICDDWEKKDNRIRVIHQENAGLSSARNVGIEASSGEYLMFVDSDDFVESAYVEELYKAITTNQADMAIAGVTYLKQDGEQMLLRVTSVEQEIINRTNAMIRYETGGILQEAYTVVWNKIYRRELWEGVRFPEGKVYEDSFVMPKVFYMCEKVVLLNSCLYIYRKREGSITAQKKERYEHTYIEMMKQRENFYEEVGIKELKVIHQIHLYGVYDYFGKQTKTTRKVIQRKLRRCLLTGRYTTKIPLERRIKNIVASISLPLYQRLVNISR